MNDAYRIDIHASIACGIRRIFVSSQSIKQRKVMITTRDEVIDRAFGVFVRMNYEKASIITIARACGLTKTGIVYYFPHKLELFMAVADKYVFQLHKPANKFAPPAATLKGFIGQYVAGVTASMERITGLIGSGGVGDCCPNFYYFHFISQVRMYYPDVRRKIEEFFKLDLDMWATVIGRAKESGEEIVRIIEIQSQSRAGRFKVAVAQSPGIPQFPQVLKFGSQIFLGASYEQAFLNGLDIDSLSDNFSYLYSLLKT